ncbi:MAG: rhodanese-like domain-containing protein [Gammaproteobacteria bacterium]|nr:rhodanese-like domain-containing protein [Gammaproteobacteria bacterium]
MRILTFVFVALTALSACAVQNNSIKSVDDLEAEAIATITSYNAASAIRLLGDDSVVFVDVREPGELAANGRIPGSVHIPRGVLEYSIDPNHPRHNKIFSSGKTVVFYCAGGGRSVLATRLAQDMGVTKPVNLEGGFSAWSKAGGTIDPPTVKK